MDENAQQTGSPYVAQHSPAEPQLPVLRFGLRQMFWCVTLVCVVLAAVVAVSGSGAAPLALLLAVLVVALHLAGTAIGTRLREHANERQAWEVSQSGTALAPILPAMPPPSLHKHGMPMPWLRTIVIAGILGGGAAGAALLAITVGPRATPIGIAVGAISTAILGGWFAFLAASFWAIFRQGWREALETDRGKP